MIVDITNVMFNKKKNFPNSYKYVQLFSVKNIAYVNLNFVLIQVKHILKSHYFEEDKKTFTY